MSLTSGTRLGVYDITAPLGVGGMGEVYRATDTNLKRQVAIKVLPAAVAADADRLARFQREAEVLAALNHPNIAAIHGLEKTPDFTALVMELVEGEDLSQRLARGAIPVEEALPIAKQIAEALEAAHEQGIIHRDLKPANIKVRDDGTVKVLDFGLAKAMDPAAASSPGLSMSPTITTPAMTQAGMILGTAAYMAPEQARGKSVDKRADIWAFGVVLYEMLTGRRAFHGEDVSITLANVIKEEVKWDALPSSVPARVRQVLTACLQKHPKQRPGDMQSVRLALDGAFETTVPQVTVASNASSRLGTRFWMSATAACALAAGVLASVHFREAPQADRLLRATMLLPPGVTLMESTAIVSPDQERVLFLGRMRDGVVQVWVRPVNSIAAQPLAGTDGASSPFWSPDGQSIGFFTDGSLKRVGVAGGSATTIAVTGAQADQSRGASWGTSDVIVFAPTPRSALQKVAAVGGPVTDVTKMTEGENTHRQPSFLPDGRHFVFAAGRSGSSGPKTIRLGSVDGTDSTVLIAEADSGASYAQGHLLYARNGALMAQPFDPKALVLTGDARLIEDDIPGGGILTEAGFSAAGGLLVHASNQQSLAELAWFDRKGNRLGVVGESAFFTALDVSANGHTAVVSILDRQLARIDLWVVDVLRGLRTRLTSGGADPYAAFSPDGKMVFFPAVRGTQRSLYRKAATGIGTEDLVSTTFVSGVAGFVSVSPDGRVLLYGSENSDRGLLLPDPMSQPESHARTPAELSIAGGNFQFSPDGHWLAYQSSQTGRTEVYVAPFPGPGPSRQISVAGGAKPRWRGDGTEIFFVAPDGRIAAARVSVRGGSVESSEPQMLFSAGGRYTPYQNYHVSFDGQRILAITPRDTAGGLTIIQDWPALLKK